MAENGDDTTPAIVLADPTAQPALYRFLPPLPHFATPTPTRIDVRQTATVETQPVVPRLSADERVQPTDPPDSRVAIDPPPSEDAQAQADLAAAGTRGYARTIAQNDQGDDGSGRGEHVGYDAPTADDELWATTTISCRLETTIDSTLPGVVRARVVQPVYDSRTHDHIVIPAGTLVAGHYNSHVIGGQARLLVAWTRLYFPDGRRYDMGSEEGADSMGTAGFDGRVDEHTGAAIRTGLLMTLFGVGTALLNPPASILNTQSVGSQVGQVAGGQLSQLGTRIANRQLEQGPTIRVLPPYDFQIVLLDDLPLGQYAR